MRRRDRGGYAVILLLLYTVVLFSVASLAVSVNGRLHSQNRRTLRGIQARAALVRLAPGGEAPAATSP